MLKSVVPFNPVSFVHPFAIYNDKYGIYSTTIMSLVLYTCLIKIAECKNEEVTRGWRKETTFEDVHKNTRVILNGPVKSGMGA